MYEGGKEPEHQKKVLLRAPYIIKGPKEMVMQLCGSKIIKYAYVHKPLFNNTHTF